MCKFVPKYLELRSGLVIKSTGSNYRVLDQDNNVVDCVIKGKFRVKGITTTNPVAVGDMVVFETGDGKVGIIKEIAERKNYIIRKSPNLSRESQIIAANIDQALLMVTLRDPVTPEEFIDRFLVSAESFRIPVVILFNKRDIYTEDELEKMEWLSDVYNKIGYRCLGISMLSGKISPELEMVIRDRITLVAGNSGVGKSTLLNALLPGADIRTEEISDYHKQGKHTTTFAEMYSLPGGGFIIDTPGIKGFGLTGLVKEEIYHFFPEIFNMSKKCRYYNCLHEEEPGCAVRDAVKRGEIEWFRYRSYINIIGDDNSKYR